jgi:hypothetical protein
MLAQRHPSDVADYIRSKTIRDVDAQAEWFHGAFGRGHDPPKRTNFFGTAGLDRGVGPERLGGSEGATSMMSKTALGLAAATILTLGATLGASSQQAPSSSTHTGGQAQSGSGGTHSAAGAQSRGSTNQMNPEGSGSGSTNGGATTRPNPSRGAAGGAFGKAPGHGGGYPGGGESGSASKGPYGAYCEWHRAWVPELRRQARVCIYP